MNTLEWDNIKINYNYIENFSPRLKKSQGIIMSHIEIMCDEELPITETGYKSFFVTDCNLKRWGGVEKFIMMSLNMAAKSDAWKFKKESKNQLTLF